MARFSSPVSPSRRSRGGVPRTGAAEWRCWGCGKLLGLRRGDRLHVSLARGHEYLASFPASCACRGCGTLNEIF